MDNRVIRILNKELSKKNQQRYCCAPNDVLNECGTKIIKAHSISRCLGINDIGESGHVFGLKKTPSLFQFDENNGIVQVEKIGVKQASTHTMFCSEHDKTIFSSIENVVFTIDKQNCFLLAYRALCMEYFKANYDIEAFHQKVQNNVSMSTFKRYEIDIFEQGHKAKLNDLILLKNIFDEVLINKKYDELVHYVIEIADVNIVSSYGYSPVLNFENEEIQDISNLNLNVISVFINVITQKEKGYIVISCLALYSDFLHSFLKGLVTKPVYQQSQLLTDFFFKTSENNYWRISWWNGLKKKHRERLEGFINNFGVVDNLSKINKRDIPGFYVKRGFFI